MLLIKKNFILLIVIFVLFTAFTSYGQRIGEYPERTIRLVIPYAPGGATDAVFRTFAEYANEHLDQPMVVVNMPGASTTVGSRFAHEAKPDGYIIFGGHNAMATTYVSGLVDFTYFDFEPIALLTSTPNFATINPQYNDWETMDEVIEYAKENPGKVNWGVNIFSTDHFFLAEMFDAAGEEINLFNLVAIEGTGAQITSLLGGHVDGCMANVAAAGNYVDAGELRFTGVAWEERLDTAPEIPTMEELGIPFTNATSRGLLAPKGTPEDILEMLAELAQKVAEDPRFIESIENMGSIVDLRTGENYIEFLKRDLAAKERAYKLME